MTNCRFSSPSSPLSGTRLVAFAGAVWLLAFGAARGDDGSPTDNERESYAFVRTIEGGAAVATQGRGEGEELEQNQPLLTGDRISTGSRSRLEILLPDRTRLVLDSDTAVRLERLAFSGDRESRATVLALEEGELLLEVPDEALGDELPRIEAAGGTVYVQEPGAYRVGAGAGGWIELVSRTGYAELVTASGSTIVRGGEMVRHDGDRWGRVEIARAEPLDALEHWSDDLVERANRAGKSARHVAGGLSYAASALDDAGDWVVVENVNYWRPRVAVGWRPYWQGRWAWTPSGYTWVSYEPWGWVPYHYGRWCLVNGYGWAWRPGPVYSPAWVYWNWTDGYAGWVPLGYYTDYYSPWTRDGLRFGVYGWAGGHWGFYNDWNFAPVHCFRSRNFRGQVRTGRDLQHETRLPEAPRGLITTDTRDFRPDRIDRPEQILHEIRGRNASIPKGELPDVTDFVGRKRDLPSDVARVIVREPTKETGLKPADSPRVAATPGWRAERPDPKDVAEIQSPGSRTLAPRSPGASPATPRTIRTIDSPRVADTKGRPSFESPSPEIAKAPVSPAGNRQAWKERAPQSDPSVSSGVVRAPRLERPEKESPAVRPNYPEPVERVISGTRRNSPKVHDDQPWSAPPTRGIASSHPTATRSSPPSAPRVATSAPPGPRSAPQVSSGAHTTTKPASRTSSGSSSRSSGSKTQPSSKTSAKSSSDDGGDRR